MTLPLLRHDDLLRIIKYAAYSCLSDDASYDCNYVAYNKYEWPLKIRLVSRQWRRAFDALWPGFFTADRNRHMLANIWPKTQTPLGDDVSRLAGAFMINLSSCPSVRDVSALAGAHSLFLNHCTDITDVRVCVAHWCAHTLTASQVSSLGGVHTLSLNGCTNVRDVSRLGAVHSLDLSFCYGVTDVSALGTVHSLQLVCCPNVSDVSRLGRVRILNLINCTGIIDVSSLGGVETLYLHGCTNVPWSQIMALRESGVDVRY